MSMDNEKRLKNGCSLCLLIRRGLDRARLMMIQLHNFASAVRKYRDILHFCQLHENSVTGYDSLPIGVNSGNGEIQPFAGLGGTGTKK